MKSKKGEKRFMGMIDKIKYMMSIVKSNDYNSEDFQKICSFVSEVSNYARRGKLFGYSISDFALATLKWMNTDESIKIFNSEYSIIKDENRKSMIDELIESKMYLEF